MIFLGVIFCENKNKFLTLWCSRKIADIFDESVLAFIPFGNLENFQYTREAITLVTPY